MFSAFTHSLMPTRIWQEEPQSSGQTKTAWMLQQEKLQTFLLDNKQKNAGQKKANISVGLSMINSNASVHSCAQTLGELPKGHRGMCSIAVSLESIPWDDPNPPRHSQVLFLQSKSVLFSETWWYLANYDSRLAF